MLMSMNEQAGPSAFDVADKCLKAEMHIVVPIMDSARRVVGDKHINRRESGQQPLDLLLVEQIISARLIPPRTGEPTEAKAVQRDLLQVQVNDRAGEWAAAIVVAFHRQD